MRRALLALVLVACAGARTERPTTRTDDTIDEAGAAQVLTVPTESEGRVWLSLWVDAGSVDADPPQVATVAAWALGGDDDARALSFGIELRAECAREDVEAKLSSWGERLRAREASAEQIDGALARLTRARRSAAADDARRADALALAALSGIDTDPLGDAADDARVQPGAVRDFLEGHVGAGRVLLVGIGDVEPERFRAAVERAFAGLPAARATPRAMSIEGGARVSVEVGDESVTSLASAHADVPRAARFAARVIERVDRDRGPGAASGDAFAFGGGAVAIVRVRGDAASFDALLERGMETIEEGEPSAGPLAPPDEPPSLAAFLGARWATRQRGEPPGDALGVGAVVAGGRADGTVGDDPDRDARDAARSTLEERLERARRGPALEGDRSNDRADVRTELGARLRARRDPNARRAAVAVIFEGGAREEDPATHGATGLLARARAHGCDAIAARELGGSLAALGIRSHPILSVDAWGLALDGPPELALALASLAPRCARAPLERGAFDAARIELTQRASASRNALAHALSADAPGRVAPEGDPAELAALALDEVERWGRRASGAARARVAIVGPLDADLAVRRAARALGSLPRGQAPEVASWEPTSGVVAAEAREEGARAWIAWSARVEGASESGARATALTASAAFAHAGGLRVLDRAWGATGGLAWAAVEVACAPEALDQLAELASRALSDPSASLAREDAHAERTRGWAGASAAGRAIELARDVAPAPSAAPTARALARAAPLFVIARPPPSP